MTAGFNPNVTEHCGATPLTIAVCQKGPKLCELLVNCGADVRGPLYVGIPTSLEMALKLQYAEIYEILNRCESDIEDDDIKSYDKLYTSYKKTTHNKKNADETDMQIPNRSTSGFLTGIVGDAGTCRINRSVMERSPIYSWIGIIPGDLHTRGAMIEACFKEQALGGFHHLVKNVLSRPKLKSEVFKDKKFEEDNYRKIREAVRDCGKSFCMAAAYEFKCSSSFPDPFALRSCFKSNGNHNKVILDSFITWLDKKSEEDTSFRYHSRMYLHYGPLMELFDYSTHNNFGIGREIVYMVQLLSFA